MKWLPAVVLSAFLNAPVEALESEYVYWSGVSIDVPIPEGYCALDDDYQKDEAFLEQRKLEAKREKGKILVVMVQCDELKYWRKGKRKQLLNVGYIYARKQKREKRSSPEKQQQGDSLFQIVDHLNAELEQIDSAARFDQFYPDQTVELGRVEQRERLLDVHLHHQVVERNRRSIRLSVKGEARYRWWHLEYYLFAPVWMKQRGVSGNAVQRLSRIVEQWIACTMKG
ncbi:MAG: hypothetical protein HN842_11580 [Gammaproteobacteria bacterium]|jgi:hypothetical protein|nr:hypothetical protein [Gammaproteobacteria bacterium]